jgi:hypothetical protein
MKILPTTCLMLLAMLTACSQDDAEPTDTDGGAAGDGGAGSDGFTGDESIDCPEYNRPPDWPPQPYVNCEDLGEPACEAAWNCTPIVGATRVEGSLGQVRYYAGCRTEAAYCFSGGCGDGTGCVVHQTDASKPCVFLGLALCIPEGWKQIRCSERPDCGG